MFMTAKDNIYCLSHPRDLCKKCYNWLSQEDVGFNDLPGCSESRSGCRDYLLGYKNYCLRFLDL
jgi:hypothetical protein